MSLNEHSAEVAEDYRHALEDLTMNSRYEITNLTVVARENTEHALAISEALQDHIKKVVSQRKLPALYVLDSIVKNVGTPYTLFFGRKLFQTFMDAYASVDNLTRRKMDEMLKTWKEPVPGSIDTRPVFPPDVTRPIENALIRARTATLQAQQESMRGQQQLLSKGRAPLPYRDTPTPPGVRPGSQQLGPYGPPSLPGTNGNQPGASAFGQQSYPMHLGTAPQIPSRLTPQPTHSMSLPPTYPQLQAQPIYTALQPGISIDQLSYDIQQLIATAKAAFAQTPHDTSIQARLKALLDLQSLLQHQNLGQDQLVLVKNQVAELAVNIRVHKPLTHTFTPTQPVVSQQSTPVPPVAVAPRPPASAPPAPVSLDSLFGQGALAALLTGASKSTTPQIPTPQPPPAASAAVVRSPPQRLPERGGPSPAGPSDPLALIAALKQSGLIRSAPGLAPPAASSSGPSSVPPALPGAAPSLRASASRSTGKWGIELRPTSLKQFRPHLISTIYDDLGPPCTQCGRRFRTDEDGRKQKAHHMDWHFRVHQLIAEAEKRGQHRSWYVDREDWIKSREAVDTDYVPPQAEAGAASGGAQGGKAAATAKLQFILVPEDSRTNTVCPICQEKFEMKWLDEAQEWVWMDAVRVGHRVYHASCHAEATRDGRGATPGLQRVTPEPVLGKRKAEDDHALLRGKSKVESY